MAEIRLVLDANNLMSALAYPRGIPGRILAAWHSGGLDVVLSKYILEEMVRALPRLPRVGLIPNEIRDLAASYLVLADIVDSDEEIDPGLRDPAEQPIRGTFRSSRAGYLITGDKDLLALADKYPIVTPAAFWERHGGQRRFDAPLLPITVCNRLFQNPPLRLLHKLDQIGHILAS